MLSTVVLAAIVASSTLPPVDLVSTGPTAESSPDPGPERPLAWDLEPARRLTLQLPGMSHHFDDPVDARGRTLPNRRYNERNWGVGLQFEEPMSGGSRWVLKTSFGLMRDSLDAMGLYAGRTLQKRLADTPRYGADLGVGAFVFLRTLRFDGPHVVVPAVLPALSVQHKPTGLGLNIVAVPRVKYGSGQLPGVVYAQFTKAL